jgi:hypothetical protein
MNTQKKDVQKKKEKPKGERTSVPRPLSWNIYFQKHTLLKYKPEVVATKQNTGYLHYRFIGIGSWSLWSPRCSYMWFVF